MSVTFGTSGTVILAATNTVTHTFNIGTLTNGAMVVGVMTSDNNGSGPTPTINTLTWNGVTVPAVTGAGGEVSAGAGTLDLFALKGPANGSNSLVCTLSASDNWAVAFWSFSGVDQTGGTTSFYNGQKSQGSGTDHSRTVSQSTNNGDATVALWGLGAAFGSASPTADFDIAPNFENIGQHTLSTGLSDSYTVTLGTGLNDQLDFVGFSLKAASGGGGFTAKFRKTLSQIGGRVGSRQPQGWGVKNGQARPTVYGFRSSILLPDSIVRPYKRVDWCDADSDDFKEWRRVRSSSWRSDGDREWMVSGRRERYRHEHVR